MALCHLPYIKSANCCFVTVYWNFIIKIFSVQCFATDNLLSTYKLPRWLGEISGVIVRCLCWGWRWECFADWDWQRWQSKGLSWKFKNWRGAKNFWRNQRKHWKLHKIFRNKIKRPPFGERNSVNLQIIKINLRHRCGQVIQLLNILGKIVREHFVDSVLVAVSNGSIVVPALKAEHIKRLLKTLNFLFYGFFLILKSSRLCG